MLWIHIGNCMFTTLTDFVLAYLPWTIISKIAIAKREKWAVGSSMSLVGLAGIVGIVR